MTLSQFSGQILRLKNELFQKVCTNLFSTTFCIYYKIIFHQGCIHFARNQIARGAMFLCHTSLPVVQEKLKTIPLLVVQEKLKTFNIGQAFETQQELHKISQTHIFILFPLLAVQEMLKIIPLLVVQEKLKAFNIGQSFETQLELHKFFMDSHFYLHKLFDKLKVNTLSKIVK